MKYGYCVSCRGPCQRPEWITYAGGQNYANNDFRQQLAIAAWHRPVTTPAERDEAKRFLVANPRLAELTERIRNSIPQPKR